MKDIWDAVERKVQKPFYSEMIKWYHCIEAVVEESAWEIISFYLFPSSFPLPLNRSKGV